MWVYLATSVHGYSGRFDWNGEGTVCEGYYDFDWTPEAPVTGDSNLDGVLTQPIW